MRAWLVLLALAMPAHADDEPELAYVSGELRGTRAVVRARYAVQLRGPMTAMGTQSLEIPDMAAFQEVMKSEAAAGAMKHDGVNPETLLILSEA